MTNETIENRITPLSRNLPRIRSDNPQKDFAKQEPCSGVRIDDLTTEDINRLLEENPELLYLTAFGLFDAGNVRLGEKMLAASLKQRDSKHTLLMHYLDSESSNRVYVPHGQRVGNFEFADAWVAKLMKEGKTAEVEFAAYRELHSRNEKIRNERRAIPKKENEKKANFYWKNLPIVTIPDIYPAFTEGEHPEKIFIHRYIGGIPRSSMLEEDTLTYFNILPTLNELRKNGKKAAFAREFIRQVEFHKNTFVLYLQNVPITSIGTQLYKEDFGETFGRYTTSLLKRIPDMNSSADEIKEKVLAASSVLEERLTRDLPLVQWRDSTQKNMAFQPSDTTHSIDDFLNEAYERYNTSTLGLKGFISNRLYHIDLEKLNRLTDPFEDRVHNVEGRTELGDNDRILLDYHMIFTELKFRALQDYREDRIKRKVVNSINENLKEIEAISDISKKRMQEFDEFIQQTGLFPFASMDQYQEAKHWMAVYRNARTANHIVTEYMPRDSKKHQAGLRFHIDQVVNSLNKLITYVAAPFGAPGNYSDQFIVLFDQDYPTKEWKQKAEEFGKIMDTTHGSHPDLERLAKLNYLHAVYQGISLASEQVGHTNGKSS